MAASRVASWVPYCPNDLSPYCFKSRPPSSLISNSATLRFTAPKSTARNDFEFNMTNCLPGGPVRRDKTAVHSRAARQSEVVTRISVYGQHKINFSGVYPNATFRCYNWKRRG